MAENKGQIESNAKGLARKRSNVEINFPIEATTSKRRRYDPIVANNSMLEETGQRASSIQENMKSIADLPSEMLHAILQNVSSVDLLKCRQTNRQWNAVSSDIIRQRADIQLRFGFEKGRFMRIIKSRHCEELLVNVCQPMKKYDTKSLTDLIDCLRMSNRFPCTSFRFGALKNFENAAMKCFISVYGKHIFSLNISLDDDPKNFVVLRDLLLNKVRNLKKLELKFKVKNPSSIPLSVVPVGFQLPMLDALYINSCYRKYRCIIENILAGARNLKQFELRKSTYTEHILNMSPDVVHDEKMVDPRDSITADDLAMLHKFNKLLCLKKARIYLTDELIAYWQKSPYNLNLKLQSLALSLKSSIWGSEMLKSSATQIINRLLLSSRNELKELSVEPLGFLPGLFIPMLGKLQKLELFGWLNSDTGTESIKIFPHPFELADNFPNLKELDVHGLSRKSFLQFQPLKPMQNVEALRLFGGKSTRSKEWLMKATPNAKTLLMVESDFPWTEKNKVRINFGAIAENLTKLKSFGWTICRIGYQDLLHSLDAVITGFPESFCKKMSAKFRNKDHLTAEELAYYQLKRCNSSILDLHELKQLDVNFFFDFDTYCEMKSDDEFDECSCSDSECEFGGGQMIDKKDDGGIDPQSELYETGFTKVSKFLAFDLMPNLKVRTHKRMV